MIEIGQSVGNYRVTARLGEGGMGLVFLAEHPLIGRKVALKAIHPQFARDAEVISRFITEAKSVNQIRHQHIVDVTDFGNTAQGDFYFVMEYLQGQGLADAIRSEGRFPPRRALSIAAQVADALQASHQHGVVHRDLKPENIFLIARGDEQDFVKVLDFGLAKLVDAVQPASHNTRAGTVMGTPYYMSPEQCEGKIEVDQRSDIYSLGVILFEMLTGKIPFGGDGFGEILVKHITVEPPAARTIVPELPAALDLILFRALAKNPDDRFQTMEGLRAALLDPDEYAATAPALAAAEDLSARVRAAMPMARAEIERKGYPAGDTHDGRAAPATGGSTLTHGIGEVAVGSQTTPDGARSSRRATAAVLLTTILMAGAILGVVYRRQAGRVVTAAVALRHRPVRLNFSSDPDGATVTRADGARLGITPLSTTVPYGEVGLTYVLQKKGYLPTTLAVVPNLAAPLFAVLEREPLPDPPAPVPVSSEMPTTAGPAAVAAEAPAAPSRRHHHNRVTRHQAEPDRDDSLGMTP
jgi:hypothetical protein